MAKFRYKRGERPLEGYTIEHGLGVGGFGEVYFAVSDAGREVALKALQNYEEIELRGIRNCMNLKSPHLVSVFDVRYNEDEQPFVIMEYVQGPSLRQLLDGSPEGIGEAKAAFFLREMAKGLTYLHEAGVVHRDLKPHNVFYEDGFVKIGDYSLCKMMSASHRTGHTMTVGTVHYMAPEIGEGRYDASVDIYALGIMLYEMLTGAPPYTGDSLGEVLMKHMTAEPKLDRLAEPYRTVIAKALSKDPADRYATPADMVEAVFGTDHVQNSVVEFNPQELTIVANMATKRALTTPSGRPASSRPGGASWGKTWTPDRDQLEDSGSSIGNDASPPPLPNADSNQGGSEFAKQSAWPPQPAPKPKIKPNKYPNSPSHKATDSLQRAPKDPIPFIGRVGMALGATAALAFVAQTTSHFGYVYPGVVLMILCGFAAAMAARSFDRYLPINSVILSRVTRCTMIACGIVLIGYWLGLWQELSFIAIILAMAGFTLPFLIIDWERHISVSRPWRIDGWLHLRTILLSLIAIKAAITMMGIHFWLPNVALLGAITAFGIGLCLQLVSPRDPKSAARAGLNPEAPQQTHVGPIVEAEPVLASAASPRSAARAPDTSDDFSSTSRRRRRRSRLSFDEKLEHAQLVGRIIAGGFGIAFFAASCIMAIVSLTMRSGPFMTLSIVGFGLTVASFGCLVGSGGWQGGAFGRMFAACMMLSWMHISAFSGDVPEPVVAMVLPVAAALLAWPRNKNKTSSSTA